MALLKSLLPPKKQLYGDRTTRETKSGIMLYDGNALDFYEWEFRTMAKYMGEHDDEKKKGLACKVLEGLHGDAYIVAKDLGLSVLSLRMVYQS